MLTPGLLCLLGSLGIQQCSVSPPLTFDEWPWTVHASPKGLNKGPGNSYVAVSPDIPEGSSAFCVDLDYVTMGLFMSLSRTSEFDYVLIVFKEATG